MLDKEIAEVIAKQLPAQVGEILQSRLKQAEADERALSTTSRMLEESKARALNLQEQLSVALGTLSRYGDVTAKETAVAKREIELELVLAKARADNAEKSKADLFNLVGIVFKNPVVKETLFTSAVKPHFPPGSSCPQTFSETSSVDRTSSVE